MHIKRGTVGLLTWQPVQTLQRPLVAFSRSDWGQGAILVTTRGENGFLNYGGHVLGTKGGRVEMRSEIEAFAETPEGRIGQILGKTTGSSGGITLVVTDEPTAPGEVSGIKLVPEAMVGAEMKRFLVQMDQIQPAAGGY